VKKNLPKDFDIGAIGNIDLVEAEAVANESVLLLNENDLIEGLEDFDLIPLKEDVKSAEDAAGRGTAAKAGVRPVVSTQKREHAVIADKIEEKPVSAPVVEPPARRHEEVVDDGRSWISIEDLDNIDEEGRTWVPLHKITVEEQPAAGSVTEEISRAETEEETPGERISELTEDETAGMDKGRVMSLDDLASDEISRPAPATEPEPAGAVKEEPVVSAKDAPTTVKEQAAPVPEGYVGINDEYMIWNMPDSEAVIAEPVQKPEERIVMPPAAEKEKSFAVAEKHTDAAPLKKEITTIREPDAPLPDRAADVHLSALKKTRRPSPDEIMPEVQDGRPAARAVFIDEMQSGEPVVEGVFEENKLEKIISGIVQVDEGSSYLLREADAEEDRKRIATVTDDFRPAYEEMFEDLDYKYGDEEMDYIHTAIVEEDYSSYIREIDEFFGTRGGKTVSTRLELLGLTADEFDSIEDMLFKGEYRDVNLYDRYHLYEFDRETRVGAKEDRRYRYLLPAEGSLIDVERDSIENDVSASSALIFEEDVQHIREQLKKRTGKTDVEVVALVERSFAWNEEKESAQEAAAPEVIKSAMAEPVVTPSAPEVHEPAAVTPVADPIRDITDRVVILEDQADVERFVKTFPEQKQVNIKTLLKYLDGLFERLPEEIIRKFASSDYFNLYLKVLNELGV